VIRRRIYNEMPDIGKDSPIVTLQSAPIVKDTECVFLCGNLQVRGPEQDYVIDTETGVITFNFNLKNEPGQRDTVAVSYNP